jgi:hypothetical protein
MSLNEEDRVYTEEIRKVNAEIREQLRAIHEKKRLLGLGVDESALSHLTEDE